MENYFFLDFDGVVCDSVQECFAASYMAYHELHLKKKAEAVSLKDKELFCACRPFIRSGEDYLLIHDLIRGGHVIDSQETFDAHIKKAGVHTMKTYGKLFYQAREAFLAAEPELWLDLNPLFPGLAGILRRAAENKNFYILSTKKPPFIARILSHHGVQWDISRVLYPEDEPKRRVIEFVMGKGHAVFVDDQLEHLLDAAQNKNIDCRLADWGYVKKPRFPRKKIPILKLEDLPLLVNTFLASDQSIL